MRCAQDLFSTNQLCIFQIQTLKICSDCHLNEWACPASHTCTSLSWMLTLTWTRGGEVNPGKEASRVRGLLLLTQLYKMKIGRRAVGDEKQICPRKFRVRDGGIEEFGGGPPGSGWGQRTSPVWVCNAGKRTPARAPAADIVRDK